MCISYYSSTDSFNQSLFSEFDLVFASKGSLLWYYDLIDCKSDDSDSRIFYYGKNVYIYFFSATSIRDGLLVFWFMNKVDYSPVVSFHWLINFLYLIYMRVVFFTHSKILLWFSVGILILVFHKRDIGKQYRPSSLSLGCLFIYLFVFVCFCCCFS